METQTITIRVSPKAAKIYNDATAEQRQKLEVLLSLTLAEMARARRPLEKVMDGISRKAREGGLSPEILESMFNQ